MTPQPGRTKRIMTLFAGLLLILIWASGGASAETLNAGSDTLAAAHSALVQHYAEIEKRMGSAQAGLLEERLDDDAAALAAPEPPDGFTMADWLARVRTVAALDASLVEQLASEKPLPVSRSGGLVERLFQSHLDRTWQPFSLYVPNPLPANPSLVILLHGNPQTEAEILSWPYFHDLADSTGTVIAAPWARGIAGYFPPADDDVYSVADDVAAAFNIPPSRTYLAGYSNGGYSVFKIGPLRPDRWKAIMCISGSIVNGETASVQRTFFSKRLYVVNGAQDDNVSPTDGARTAGWLVGVGIDTGFYQEPKGTHYLPTLIPALNRAWHDMLADRIYATAQAAARAQGSGAPDTAPAPISPMRTSY